jgi:hypothetical protein
MSLAVINKQASLRQHVCYAQVSQTQQSQGSEGGKQAAALWPLAFCTLCSGTFTLSVRRSSDRLQCGHHRHEGMCCLLPQGCVCFVKDFCREYFCRIRRESDFKFIEQLSACVLLLDCLSNMFWTHLFVVLDIKCSAEYMIWLFVCSLHYGCSLQVPYCPRN